MNTEAFLKIIVLIIIVFSILLIVQQFVQSDRDVDRKPDVILVTLESTYAGHTGTCYEYKRQNAPHLCSLAEDGIKANNAYSQGTWTLKSLSSLFASEPGIMAINENITTLAERFSNYDYRTKAIVSGPKYVNPGYGLDQGFSSYEKKDIDSEAISDLKFSESRGDFIWLHLSDPHCPYEPLEEDDIFIDQTAIETEGRCGSTHYNSMNLTSSQLETIKAKHDGEIKTADSKLGDLVAELKSRGIYEETVIVVTADHGETFRNYGDLVGHGPHSNYSNLPEFPPEELTHVPLVVKLSNQEMAGTEIEKLVSHVDLGDMLIQEVADKDSRKEDFFESREAIYYPRFKALRTLEYFYMEDPLFTVNRTRDPLERSNHSIGKNERDRLNNLLEKAGREEYDFIYERLSDLDYVR